MKQDMDLKLSKVEKEDIKEISRLALNNGGSKKLSVAGRESCNVHRQCSGMVYAPLAFFR